MNLSDCYLEEDLFPKIFIDYEERDYGILFYNEDNMRRPYGRRFHFALKEVTAHDLRLSC
ncbi:MAG: hypothetical protein IKO25_11490 [Clostridia bacterium]|nr:hypothetical protein [Clostridia bacterium]